MNITVPELSPGGLEDRFLSNQTRKKAPLKQCHVSTSCPTFRQSSDYQAARISWQRRSIIRCTAKNAQVVSGRSKQPLPKRGTSTSPPSPGGPNTPPRHSLRKNTARRILMMVFLLGDLLKKRAKTHLNHNIMLTT